MSHGSQNWTIRKGETFIQVLRWETLPYIYKAISAITRAAPAVITATGHDIPNGWQAAVVSVEGMREINAKYNPPRADDYHQVTVLTANTVELNDVNSAQYTAYTSGGYLQYRTPVSLSGYTARLQIRETTESEDALVSLTSSSGIALDNTAKTITITFAAADTEDYDFTSGVYDLELVSGAGVVTCLLKGTVTIEPEVTR